MSSGKLPEYLGNSHKPTLRIRCPIHGLIPFSQAEREIIDHSVFQRLRHIKQLALCYYVYPGATHTRFEHSLGVMHFCTQAFDLLLSRHAEQMKRIFSEIPEIGKDKTLAKVRQLVRLVGLTHDLGHPPFSHVGDTLLQGQKHEQISASIVEEILRGLIERTFFEGAATLLVTLLDQKKVAPPQLRIIEQIFSGQLDFDRADYLLRDAYHCGVQYGRFDHYQLIDCLELGENPETGQWEICILDDGIHVFEALLLARYQMFLQVYYHKIRRIYDHYLEKYLEHWVTNRLSKPMDILSWNDLLLYSEIYQEASSNEWASRIIRREHHREIFHSRSQIDPKQRKIVEIVCEKLNNIYPEKEFIYDAAEQWVHKLYVPDQVAQEERIGNFYVKEGKQKPRMVQVGRVSKLIANIPQKIRIARIFTDVTDQKDRKKIESRAYQLYNEEGGLL